MQPKVSMVMPCYNKVKWIGGMFDSVLAQKWNNLELILVNDGSTDGTRDIIEYYLPKFHTRGYEVIVVDQENQGLGAAVKNGLMKITGEYVCIPDCDDELNPEYVSDMAGWLLSHTKDNWVFCDIDRFGTDRSYKKSKEQKLNIKYPYELLESFIFQRHIRSVCLLMIRVSYLIECRVLEVFRIETRVTQEPQIWIPLILGGSTPVYIRKPLYKYFVREDSSSQTLLKHTKVLYFIEEYIKITEKTYKTIKVPNNYENFIFDIGRLIIYNYYSPYFPQYDESVISNKLVELLKERGAEFYNVNETTIYNSGVYIAAWYISDKLIGREIVQRKRIERFDGGRIIAYAAFGRAAKRIETGLINSDIRPDVYWDIKAKEGDNIRGVPVVYPDFENLTWNDTILMLLLDNSIVEMVTKQIEASSKRVNIWYNDDILDHLVGYYYAKEVSS